MLPVVAGRAAWKFSEENFDIDNIIGVENIKVKDIEILKQVCMVHYEEDFSKRITPGDVLIAGDNFGYGHPHWGAFQALRALEIKAVFAQSFYPGFYRGETGNGFILVEVPGILSQVDRWDRIELDWEQEEVIVNNTTRLKCNPIPQKTKDLVECGGLIPYLKEKRLNPTLVQL